MEKRVKSGLASPVLLFWFWAGIMGVGVAALLTILLYKALAWAWML